MLQCYCDYTPEPGQILWEYPGSGLAPVERSRATRCADCGDRIAPGDDALAIRRWKVPETEIECRIYGEDDWSGPPRAPHYLCDQCGALFLGLARITNDCCWHYTDTCEAVDDYHRMLRVGEVVR